MSQVAKVVEWVNDGKPLWWRHVIRRVMEHGGLQQLDLQLIYEVAKMEFNLIEKTVEYHKYIKLVSVAGFEAEAAAVNLASLGNVKNVSSLIEGVTLRFPIYGLTALYGDNGSGKSSYAKILKSACLTRGDVPVITTNVFKPSREASVATLSVSIDGGEPIDTIWSLGGEANPELKSIRVFDSQSANHYISKADSVEYKPAEVRLLDALCRACQFVKDQLTLEMQPLNIPFEIPNLNPLSKVSGFCRALAAATPDALNAQCGGEDEVPELERLKKDIADMSGKTPAELKATYITRLKHRKPLLEFLQTLSVKLSDESLGEILKLHNDKKTKLKAAEVVRENTLNGLPIEGIGTEAWKQMWFYAQQFIAGNGRSFPPAEGEHCPTCLQKVDKLTTERMERFNAYIIDQSQIDAGKAIKALTVRMNEIAQLDFSLERFGGIIAEIEQANKEAIIGFGALMQQLNDRQYGLLEAIPVFAQPPLDLRFIEWLGKQVGALSAKANIILDDGSLTLSIEANRKALIELEDRQKLTVHKEHVIQEIRRIGILGRFASALPSTNLNLITRFGSTLAKTGSLGLINDEFAKELAALGFNTFDVMTKTQGSAGQQKLTLQIADNKSKIVNIASEGEQKCIALASFMAELTIDNRKSAIIFDDPVNSLDHKWRRRFAERIAKESLVRQVIVLTHDLSFLKMLEESVSMAASTLEIIAIRKHGRLSGYPLNNPPWGILNTAKRVGELNKALQLLAKLSKEPDPELYFDKAKTLYNKKRETWERLVEEWLLKGGVERFGRDVKTQNIKYLANGITDDDVKTVNDGMKKCSTFMLGHDRAHELGMDFPEYSEVEEDVLALEQYFKKLKRRR